MGGMMLRENEKQAYGWEERPLYATIWFNKFEDKFLCYILSCLFQCVNEYFNVVCFLGLITFKFYNYC
jgi:hypothetical protein